MMMLRAAARMPIVVDNKQKIEDTSESILYLGFYCLLLF